MQRNVFNGNEFNMKEKRDKQIALRLTSEEYEQIKELAAKNTAGNISDFMRSVYLQWLEAFVKVS